MTAVMELEGVAKVYGGGRGGAAVRALDGVDLEIREGELLAIVGASGSGKSTLLAIMGGLARPSEGTVRLDGHDVAKLSDRRLAGLRASRLGFVFQQFHLVGSRSALENVADGALYRGVSPRKRRVEAAARLAEVGLADRARHRARLLSGGERQRVAIARALVGDPAVVLADEPTGNLDSATGSEVIGLLRALHEEGRTIVVITHDEAIAATFPRTIVLRDGRVVADTALVAV